MEHNQISRSRLKAELIYSLEEKPPIGGTIFAAMQHLMVIVVSIMAPL